MTCELSRRAFLRLAAGATFAAAGCATNAPEPPVGLESDGSVRVKGGGALKPGTTLAFTLPGKLPGIVFMSAAGQLGALSAICTHAGCTVEWQEDTKHLHCPCHNSNFSLDGKVLNGPARKPLQALKVRADGNDALVFPA